MKASQILSRQILNVKVFLIKTDHGALMVDAGIPGFESRIRAAFADWGTDPRTVSHIILTHGHLDHIGCLAYLRSITGAAVICHRSIGEQLAGGRYEPAVPRVSYWKILNCPVSRLLASRIKPLQPNILVDNQLVLDDFGVQGRIIHTPGHSPGSCSLILGSGDALIGDLIRENKAGRVDTGLFYSDREEIYNSLLKINSWRPERVHLSHGGVISGEELERFLLTRPD